MAQRVLEKHFVEGGRSPEKDFKLIPMYTINPPKSLMELTVLGSYVEVWLAKEGHKGLVGINFLEKIQMPTLAALYGALLAGVDYVLVGAGIPLTIAEIIDDLIAGKAVKLEITVEGALKDEKTYCYFDPQEFCGGNAPVLKRPMFLAIISSATLAQVLARKSKGKVNGFIVEGATAGGHNAPPRGQMQLNDRGEPVYGERDTPDLIKIAAEGLPFWLAGSFGEPGKLKEALSLGAVGIQVGTAFAYCDESGMDPEIKKQVIEKSLAGTLEVFTDPLASPTGFPFKVVGVPESMSDLEVYEDRCRVCELGYLRKPYRKADGSIGYRCASEPISDYEHKGGKTEDTINRKCICGSLTTTINLGSKGDSALVTSGDNVAKKTFFVPLVEDGKTSYGAAKVVEVLLKDCE